MGRRASGHKRAVDHRLIMAAAGAVSLAAARWASADYIGLSQLPAVLNGAGVNVAQVEAGGSQWETSPAYVNQPGSLFTYIDQNGAVSNTYSAINGSSHANIVGDNFFGVDTNGVATGVNHVDDYEADYFLDAVIGYSTNTELSTLNNDVVINQSFAFAVQSSDPNWNADETTLQNQVDQLYDQYEINHPATIFVSAAGGATNFYGNYVPLPPGTAYDSISVNPGGTGANGVTGPTFGGRSIPDISAFTDNASQDNVASYTTPIVSGAAAILVQAGALGYGGGVPSEAAAQDPRVVKALLMNGATKTGLNWSNGVTSTQPLNTYYGAGLVNVYRSFVNLEGGLQAPVANTTQAAGNSSSSYPTPAAGSSTNRMSGWNLANSTLNTTSSVSDIDHYVIPVSGSGASMFTATLDWWSNPDFAGYSASNPINNFYMYLYDVTTSTSVAESISTVDNLQEIYASVTGGNTYDLMVMKQGGTLGSSGVLTSSDTYAVAWSVPEPASFSLCLIGFPLLARRRRKTALEIVQG
jgi:hypothetical protein